MTPGAKNIPVTRGKVARSVLYRLQSTDDCAPHQYSQEGEEGPGVDLSFGLIKSSEPAALKIAKEEVDAVGAELIVTTARCVRSSPAFRTGKLRKNNPFACVLVIKRIQR
jgi:hypothetical protein